MKKKKPELEPELQAIAAEFPDFVDIIAGANYDSNGPEILEEDPNMRYYLAAPEEIKGRPDGVSAVKRLGYRVSEKQVLNPADDCILMETPKSLYDLRIKRSQMKVQKKIAAVKKQVTKGTKDLEALTDHRGGDGLPPGFRKVHGE